MKTALFFILLSVQTFFLTGQTLRPDHPRLMLDADIRAALLAKKAANDPAWTALKNQADAFADKPVMTWDGDHFWVWNDDYIFYTYQGGGWYEAAFPLAFAHQMTKGANTDSFPTTYSDKLLELADTILAAHPFEYEGNTYTPIRLDSYFCSRFVCPTVAFIFDYCYDELGPARRAALANLMVEYYDDIRENAYQTAGRAGDNYYIGHMYGIGLMGLAAHGDHARAPEMLAWARNRFDGTPSALIGNDTALTWLSQVFEGGYPIVLSTENYNNPTDIFGAPWAAGIHPESWGYGAGSIKRTLDLMQCFQTATTDYDVFDMPMHHDWLVNLLRGFKHSLQPSRGEMDYFGDWGGSYGGFVNNGYPTRLAYFLAGTPEGPWAQHLRYQYLQPNPNPCVVQYTGNGIVSPDEKWERFYFEDLTRPATPMSEPTWYSQFPENYPQGAQVNGPLPYFIMRSSWDTSATWASAMLGGSHYEGHEHHAAGTMTIRRGQNYLLMEANIFKNNDVDCWGTVGNQSSATSSSGANTLFFHDNCTYYPFCNDGNTPDYILGGQSSWGKDEIIAAQQTDSFSYVRTNLTSAYNWTYDTSWYPQRTLDFYYRSLVYLPELNTFAVYDQATANPWANTNGQHIKHLRWHLTNEPSLNGTAATVQRGDSKLNIKTVFPTNASVLKVNQLQNPDSVFVGYSYNNSQTWRLEVSTPGAPLAEEFVTILQPAQVAEADVATTLLDCANMRGSLLEIAGKTPHVVLFNKLPGAVPAPIANTSYAFALNTETTHMLCGMVPGAAYAATFDGQTVTVTQQTGGQYIATASGTLQFSTGAGGNNCQTPVAGISMSPANGLPLCGSTVTLTASPAQGVAYQWFKNNVAITGATASTYQTTEGGSYKVVVTNVACNLAATSTALTVQTNFACHPNFCAAAGTNSNAEWIQSISIGANAYASGNNGGYGNFLNTVGPIVLQRGVMNTYNLTPGYIGAPQTEYWRVWIDFNHDGDFADSGENIRTVGGKNTRTFTYAVANNRPLGTARMRVAMKRFSPYPNACGTFAYGEVEDYTVLITSATGNRSDQEGSWAEAAGRFRLPVQVLPNPANETARILFPGDDEFEFSENVQIFNTFGALISETARPVGTNELQINTADWPAGIYFVKTGLRETVRFVVEHR